MGNLLDLLGICNILKVFTMYINVFERVIFFIHLKLGNTLFFSLDAFVYNNFEGIMKGYYITLNESLRPRYQKDEKKGQI